MTVTFIIDGSGMSLGDISESFQRAFAAPEVKKAIQNNLLQIGGKRAFKLG